MLETGSKWETRTTAQPGLTETTEEKNKTLEKQNKGKGSKKKKNVQ